jgi:hypothetical protein
LLTGWLSVTKQWSPLAMRIQFEVDGALIEFRRSWFTGRAELLVQGEVVPLQSALDPATHVSLSLTKVWRRQIGNSEVVIEKVRPLVLPGLRPHTFRVLVNDQVLAKQTGF